MLAKNIMTYMNTERLKFVYLEPRKFMFSACGSASILCVHWAVTPNIDLLMSDSMYQAIRSGIRSCKRVLNQLTFTSCYSLYEFHVFPAVTHSENVEFCHSSDVKISNLSITHDIFPGSLKCCGNCWLYQYSVGQCPLPEVQAYAFDVHHVSEIGCTHIFRLMSLYCQIILTYFYVPLRLKMTVF